MPSIDELKRENKKLRNEVEINKRYYKRASAKQRVLYATICEAIDGIDSGDKLEDIRRTLFAGLVKINSPTFGTRE